MAKQQISPLLVLLVVLLPHIPAQNTDSGPSYLPALGGECEGAGNLPAGNLVRKTRFLNDVVNPVTEERHLQTNVIDAANNTWVFTDEDIPLCCAGNGDFDFLKKYLQIGGIAEDDAPDGFDVIPGQSYALCRRGCRDEEADYDIEQCYIACFCRQNCPISRDCLTQDCKVDNCEALPESLEKDVCLDECDRQCGERCRSSLNGYVVPIDIYGEALKILDCFYGDLIGDRNASCAESKEFWEAAGHTCTVTQETGLECVCDTPGTCYNEVYPCPYDFHCTSNAPSFVPSSMPSDVPSSVPSDIPSYVPSTNPSSIPSSEPSSTPSDIPSYVPSSNPSSIPSSEPSSTPSDIPSYVPSSNPSSIPSYIPSYNPSSIPSTSPSTSPSKIPTWSPTPRPTKGKGKGNRTDSPTKFPTFRPTPRPPTNPPVGFPTSAPTRRPTQPPVGFPTSAPTKRATPAPTGRESSDPSSMPSKLANLLSTGGPTSVPTKLDVSVMASLSTAVPTSPPTRLAKKEKGWTDDGHELEDDDTEVVAADDDDDHTDDDGQTGGGTNNGHDWNDDD